MLLFTQEPDQGWLFLPGAFTERAEEYPLPQQASHVIPCCDSLVAQAQTKLENLELELSQTQGTFTSCLKVVNETPVGLWRGPGSPAHLIPLLPAVTG